MRRIAAEVVGLSGREAVIAQTLQGIASYKIAIRYRENIKANDQVVWHRKSGDLELNILAPPNDPWGQRRFCQIYADSTSPQNAGG
jgi:head-tail adaptor